MAKALTKPKKKTVRAARRVSGMAAMPTKSWHDAKYYVHYMVEGREWGTTIKSWIKKNRTKDEAAAVNRLPDWKVNMFSHWATTAYLMENNPELAPEHYKERFQQWVNELIAEGKTIIAEKAQEEKESEKKKKYVPTIQERLEEAAEEKTGEIDEWIDDFLRDPKANSLKDKMPLDSFKANQINLGHTRWIQKWFEGPYQELEELVNLPTKNLTDDEQQLKEGYNHLTKPQQKELYEFHKRIIQALEILRAEKKQARPKKIRQKSPADLVKKLKFKPSDPQYGIASVNPQDIIGASAVVVFNTKNRKLGIYYPSDYQTLSVKGTTLQFFDEHKSVQKTIRKPEEVLPEWKKVTKHKLPNLFGYLKTTETKMNGRMSDDIIILKVFK